MKIVTLMSSYRKNGNTARLVEILHEQIKAISREICLESNIPIETETVFLGHAEIKPCRGCRVCFDQGEEKCPLKDDLLTIKAKLDEAGCVILASPVYVEDVNGIMKNWIDRMAFICHRPEYFGKSAFVVSTSGIGSTRHTLKTMANALRTWGFYVLGGTAFATGALMKKDEMAARYQVKINKMVAKILRGIRSTQSRKPGLVALTIFNVQQQYFKNSQKAGTIDYTYWNSKGWLEPKCSYYVTHRANPLKVMTARGLGPVIARFVLK